MQQAGGTGGDMMEGHHLLVSIAESRDIDANARYHQHEYEMWNIIPVNNSEKCETFDETRGMVKWNISEMKAKVE